MLVFACTCKSQVFTRVLCLASIKRRRTYLEKRPKNDSQNWPRKATTTPRIAFASEKKRNEMIPEINANIFPKREPKSHDSAEDSIDNNDQPHPKINKKVTQNSFQMAPQRESQTALGSAISSLFFACVLRLVSRCPWEPSWKPPERSGDLWGGPGGPRKPPRGPKRPQIPFFHVFTARKKSERE